MTREEAITVLKGISWQMGSVKRWENIEAIDMAIEALSTPSGDLISRADAIRCVDYWIDNDATDDAQARAVAVKNDLRYMPSADAVSREEYEEVKAYMDTLVDAFIEDGEELAESVKVVRCKDCKWYGHIGCAIRIVDDSDKPKANDYCSFAERREP